MKALKLICCLALLSIASGCATVGKVLMATGDAMEASAKGRQSNNHLTCYTSSSGYGNSSTSCY